MTLARHIPPLSKTRGLTALDLAVSLAIIAVLVAAAVPAIRQIGMHQRMKAAIGQFHSDLNLARSQSINQAFHAVMCPRDATGACADTGTWQHGWLVFFDGNDDREWQQHETLLRDAPAVDGPRILSSGHRTRLRFFPNGTAPGSNATITFCDDRGNEAARQLTLSASGRTRLKSAGETDTRQCEA